MKLTTGFFKLDRGILKYFEKPFSEIEAWIWMISQAEYNGDGRGRIKGSMREFGKVWGKDKKTVSRWLKKWATEQTPRISIKYAMCNVTSLHNKNATGSATEGATENATGVTVITLLNYDKYQRIGKRGATETGTGGATETGTFLKEEEKKRKKRNKSMSIPPKDVEVIKSELEKVDLPKLRQKFPQKDVNATWEEFYECCISGTAKKPKPNPYDYVDFEKGFLDLATQKTRHRLQKEIMEGRMTDDETVDILIHGIIENPRSALFSRREAAKHALGWFEELKKLREENEILRHIQYPEEDFTI